jgi:hypothetical protein
MKNPDKTLMLKSKSISRRDFLRSSSKLALGVGAGAAMPNIFLNKIKAATGENPSEFIRVGFVGVGGQGLSNMRALMKNAVAVCDVDSSHLPTRIFSSRPIARTSSG